MATYSDPTVLTPTISTTQRVQSGAILACIAGFLSLVMAGYLFWQNQSYIQQQKTLDGEVKQLSTDLDKLSPTKDKLLYYDNSAKGLHTLYDNQKHWQKVLTELETHLFKKMALTNFQFDEKGAFTFSGYTTDYTQYAKIYSSFTDPSVAKYFTKVRPTSVSTVAASDDKSAPGIAPGSVVFTFDVVLSPSVMEPEKNTEESDTSSTIQ